MAARRVRQDFDRGISSAIKRLRDALGDSAENPIFIETIDRRGYRWIAPTHFPAATPSVAASGGSAEEKKALLEAPPPAGFSPWRALLYALPLLALAFALWISRPSYRTAKAGGKSRAAAPASSLHRAANREAEDYYLKGRFYWNKRTPESLNQAVDSFTQAIVHDPNYSDAYVGLADCYNLLREYTMMPASEAYLTARVRRGEKGGGTRRSFLGSSRVARFRLFFRNVGRRNRRRRIPPRHQSRSQQRQRPSLVRDFFYMQSVASINR